MNFGMITFNQNMERKQNYDTDSFVINIFTENFFEDISIY